MKVVNRLGVFTNLVKIRARSGVHEGLSGEALQWIVLMLLLLLKVVMVVMKVQLIFIQSVIVVSGVVRCIRRASISGHSQL